MKQIFFTATLILSLLAFAGTETPSGIRHFKITAANYNAAHITHAGSGTLTINYNAGVVHLEVMNNKFCPLDKFCAQLVPMPLSVKLSITSIETDECGIYHVTALIDMRPADGDLQQIEVEDPTNLKCQTFVAVIPKARYLTSFYDRINGGEVSKLSTMELELMSTSKD